MRTRSERLRDQAEEDYEADIAQARAERESAYLRMTWWDEEAAERVRDDYAVAADAAWDRYRRRLNEAARP